MVALQPIFLKAYWTLAIAGILWAAFILSLIHPTIQRHALYAHKIWPPFGMGGNVTNPEEFGFASKFCSKVDAMYITSHHSMSARSSSHVIQL
jgi:hypothetical protein